MKKIHVGFLLSYDYEKLKLSIPPVYKDSDRIFIAIDSELRTWSGHKFTIEVSFYQWLKTIDVDNKIEIYTDDFYIPTLSAIENDTRERHLLSHKMGIGNWLIQIDADEYFVNFNRFVYRIHKYDHYLDNPESNKIQIAAFWIIIYKYTENGILYVDKPMKAIFATNYPNYKCARRTDERVIYLDNIVLHESLSRSKEELAQKISNWGHNDEVNEGFMRKWIAVNEKNYKEFSDFYYIKANRWRKLNYFPTRNISEIRKFLKQNKTMKLGRNYLRLKNFGQWFKHRIKK
ncbi:hypothetical protein [Flavobacterium sp. 7A]|uniref:hypothetical protein n=1 Tax=Flavobacterium sp. 7A TaxID=2940571 RepID=UPI00222657DE|nr:hypothetical protein [Flavobacterium sp. 7A]MCW2119234.1 hypothetical protein [Flavobacterium sp. 7A]